MDLLIILIVKNNMYEIGTSEGRLPNLYGRNQITISKESFIKVEDHN